MKDFALKKKLRRNNKIIFEQLLKFGFPGSYRTVCNYIAEWKDKMLDEADEIKEEAERLTHPPAEAQVDFGVTEAVQDGKFKNIHCLILSFPYSNGGFTVPLPAENRECFLDGLKTLFGQAGFVPRKLRLDNLSAAVIQVRGNGKESIFTDEFQRFMAHYGFEAQACNARKGNEKRHIENKVGYVRYNFFTPSPVIKDLSDLQSLLLEHHLEDHRRRHYKKGNVIADLLKEEKKYGLALPTQAYPVFKETMVTANKYGEVIIDKQAVHIPNSYHYNKLHLITYWNRFKVISTHSEVLFEGPRAYMNKARKIPWKSILNNWMRKPRSIVYSKYFSYLPERIAYHLNIDSKELKKERVRWLLSVITKYEMKEINERFYELLPTENEQNFTRHTIEHPYDVNWSIYDSLQPMNISEVKEDTHV